jgi:hypothetical protein
MSREGARPGARDNVGRGHGDGVCHEGTHGPDVASPDGVRSGILGHSSCAGIVAGPAARQWNGRPTRCRITRKQSPDLASREGRVEDGR